MGSTVSQAYELARSTRLKAYAPYSKYLVGASIKIKGQDKIISGCNVENASYGATICGERNAIFGATAEYGRIEIEFIVLVTDNKDGAVPCAMCLQVIAEFSQPNTNIYIGNLIEVVKSFEFRELLPNSFSSISLPKE